VRDIERFTGQSSGPAGKGSQCIDQQQNFDAFAATCQTVFEALSIAVLKRSRRAFDAVKRAEVVKSSAGLALVCLRGDPLALYDLLRDMRGPLFRRPEATTDSTSPNIARMKLD